MKGLIDIHHHAVPDFYVKATAETSIKKVNGFGGLGVLSPVEPAATEREPMRYSHFAGCPT